MIRKIFAILTGMRTTGILVVLFATAMAVATFIENDYGTATAKSLIYNAKWFELLMLLLMVNFLGNISRYRLHRREKWPVFLFHLSFVVVLAGAFVTRYIGYEGTMHIREGETSDTMLSEYPYIYVRVDNGKVMKEFSRKVLFGRLGRNNYHLSGTFGIEEPGIPFDIRMKEFIPNVKRVFVPGEEGDYYIRLAVSGEAGSREEVFLKNGETRFAGGILLTFGKPVEGAVNFSLRDGELYLVSPVEGNVMNMQDMSREVLAKDSIYRMSSGRLYGFGTARFVLQGVQRGKVEAVPANANEKNDYPYDRLRLEIRSGGQSEEVELEGAAGASPRPVRVSLNGLNYLLYYGSKEIELPFAVRLDDFILERYPGTHSPSSYMSKVHIMDAGKNKNFDYDIYMNHVLDYRGYRFFQASYDPDELGTVLSVNHDFWGMLITYSGYFLMGLGMIFALFTGKTRFRYLSRKLDELSKKALVITLLSATALLHAQERDTTDLRNYTVNRAHAERFGRLLIQDFGGRIKPVNTYALEVLRKVYKKDTYHGLTAGQVLLSAQVFPGVWSREYIVKAKPGLLGTELSKDLGVKDGHISVFNVFRNGKYGLEERVNRLFRMKKSDQNATDKEIIKLDDRINVWLSVLRGDMMRIYPKKGDRNNTWYTGLDTLAFSGKDTLVVVMHRLYMVALWKAVQSGDYSQADEFLGYIESYQRKSAAHLMPSQTKIQAEILYNKVNVFKRLMFYYMAVGTMLLFLVFINLFRPGRRWVNTWLKVFSALAVLGLMFHLGGLGLRWYISGHSPWSDGYESVVFIAFVTVVAGLVYSRRHNKFTLATTVLFASFLLGIAHGSSMNPEISNLVPVLKSYWLMIHVAVITASYGFLGMSSLLGLMAMVIYVFRNSANHRHFTRTLKELTYISESSMTVGLYALSLGTFLGGVWASESWGRYWSWDPKEVWSLISMMVYVFVLHMRLIPGLKGTFAYHTAALFSIGTLIMTYFGVNYYLSGMHSYATGDPVPIPFWIVPAVLALVLLVGLAYWRKNLLADS